jgi:hypothetical protein
MPGFSFKAGMFQTLGHLPQLSGRFSWTFGGRARSAWSMIYTYTNLLRSLARSSLLILDDWRCDEITVPGAQDLLKALPMSSMQTHLYPSTQ